jgi:O-antigen/teichoic acid export membrane protein
MSYQFNCPTGVSPGHGAPPSKPNGSPRKPMDLGMHSGIKPENVMHLLSFGHYLRIKPFDTATQEGRTQERYRRAAWSTITNLLNKGLAMAVMLLSVNWTISYLGAERFGIWMTIASFAGMLTFLDLGVGNALVNHIAENAAQEKPAELEKSISGGLGFLGLIGVTVTVLLLLLAALLPWAALIKVADPQLVFETRRAALLFALLFGFYLFTSGIQRVFWGLQRAFEGHFVAAISSLLAIMALWVAAKSKADVTMLLAATLGIQSLAGFPLLLLLFLRKQISIKEIKTSTSLEGSKLLRAGGLFLVLQIGTMIGWGADSLIISGTLGATSVVVYAVTQKLFQFVTQPLATVNAPLWSAYSDARARGDRQFIRQTLWHSMVLTLTVATVSVFLISIFSEWLIFTWTDGTIKVPRSFIYTFAVLVIFESCGNAFAMFLNGMQIVRQQVIVVILFCFLTLPLKIIGIHYLGEIVIPLTTLIVYSLIHVYFYGFLFRHYIKSLIN